MGRGKGPSATYLARARALAEAVDIAVAAFGTEPAPGDDGLDYASSSQYGDFVDLKLKALDPPQPFANLKSLAYLEDAFFTFWNESTGPQIEHFWAAIAERKLPFERKDVIGKVLRRGRIQSAIEYEHVTDAFVVLRQMGRISADEALQLSEMLGDYEDRKSRRR